MSDNQTLREALIQALETGQQSAAGERTTAADQGDEFARFIAQHIGINQNQEN